MPSAPAQAADPVGDGPRSKWFKLRNWNSNHPKATPYPAEWKTTWYVLARVLDLIRDRAGCAIWLTPNGGYRNPEHNRAVGGRPMSEHKWGRAADIQARKLTPRKLHDLILSMYRAGELPDLGGLGIYDWGVHVDIRPHEGRRLKRWDETTEARRRNQAP